MGDPKHSVLVHHIVAYHLQYEEYGEGLTQFTLDTFCTASNKSYIEVENGEQGYI